MITDVEQELLENGSTVIQTTGRSMEPILHNRKSTVVLERPENLKKYDVVLFKRNDELVLHRIIKIKNDKYKIRGDNCVAYDLVSKDNIIGVMTGFFPNESETYITNDNAQYKKYLKTLKFRYPKNIVDFYLYRLLKFIFGSNRRAKVLRLLYKNYERRNSNELHKG